MRSLPLLATLATIALSTVTAPAQMRLLQADDLPGRDLAATQLAAAIRARHDLATTVALAALAGRSLPAGSAARHRLELALRDANLAADETAAQRALYTELGDLVAVLRFRPRQEASLPLNFPGFAAVDELELRSYPAYRMVRTSMRRGSTSAFWPLFRHIQSNDIAMTTPVQMDWQSIDGAPADRPLQMAFLYSDPAIEPEHLAAGVEVVDVPAGLVLSIGAIGDDRRDVVDALRDRLLAFVAAAGGTLEVAGQPRTMGYNSPSVPRDQRYFEVQLPVQRVATVR